MATSSKSTLATASVQDEDDQEDERLQQGVQALETGLDLLQVFVESFEAMKLKDIAAASDVHPAKAHRYLVSFIRKGYVVQDQSGRYFLGPSALRLGLSSLAQIDPVRLASPVLEELSDEFQETVFTAVWSPEGPVIVQWRGPWRALSVNVRTGSIMPMLSSATGHVFSTFLPEKDSREIIRTHLQRKDNSGTGGIRNLSEVQQMRNRIRKQGYSTTLGGYVSGINAIAVPVFNHDGSLALSIAILGTDHSLTPENIKKISKVMKSKAEALSTQLGYRADNPVVPDSSLWA